MTTPLMTRLPDHRTERGRSPGWRRLLPVGSRAHLLLVAPVRAAFTLAVMVHLDAMSTRGSRRRPVGRQPPGAHRDDNPDNGLFDLDGPLLPAATGTTDLVVTALALTHVADPTSVFAEFARVLRPGGHHSSVGDFLRAALVARN